MACKTKKNKSITAKRATCISPPKKSFSIHSPKSDGFFLFLRRRMSVIVPLRRNHRIVLSFAAVLLLGGGGLRGIPLVLRRGSRLPDRRGGIPEIEAKTVTKLQIMSTYRFLLSHLDTDVLGVFGCSCSEVIMTAICSWLGHPMMICWSGV